MAALTLSTETYFDKVFGGWQGKSAGVTLGAGLRGQMTPGRNNYYSPVPGQPVASLALDFPLVWLLTLLEYGPEITPEDLAVAWLEHLDYSQDEFGYAALNLRRGLPPPASGAHSNWFRQGTGAVLRADLWAMVAPGAPQAAAAFAYHDAKLDHSEEGLWAAMFLAAMGSAAFFLSDAFTLLTIGLAMIPRTCRTARAVKTALAAAQRGASWLEARESVQHDVGHPNFTDAPQNMGFFTIGLLYGVNDFGGALCAAVNCGYDAEAVGGALGAILGIRHGRSALPDDWTRPIGDIVIPGFGMRDLDAPTTLTDVAERTVRAGKRIVAARCPDVEIVESAPVPAFASLEWRSDPTPSPASEPAAAEPLAAPPLLPTAPAAAASALPAPAEPSPATPPASADLPAPAAAPEIGATSALADAAPLLPSGPAASAGESPPAGEDALTPGPLPGVFRPQAVSREATPVPPSMPPGATALPTPDVRPLTPDPVSAIAWADSTQVKPLLVTPPNALVGQVGPFEVIMDTGDSPTIGYLRPRTLSFSIVNRGAEAFSGRIALLAPPGWQITGPPNLGQRQYMAAHTGTFRGDFTLRVPEDSARIDIANAVTLRFTPESGEPREAEFVLMGAACWWTVGVFANFDGEGFDRSYLPEDRPGLRESYVSRSLQSARWEKAAFPESVLDLEPVFRGSAGVCYGQTTFRSPTLREARLVANTNSGVKVWLNGALVLRRFQREVFRPVLGSGNWAVDVLLNAGDNPVMVKWVRGSEPYQFSLTLSDRDGRGLPEVGNTSW